MLKNLFSIYERHAYTHNYIMGYTENGKVYMALTTSAVVADVLTLDTASRGAGKSIRYKATSADVRTLKRNALEIRFLCSAEYLEAVAHTLGKQVNRGAAFEKLVTEYFGQTWKKDSVPFTKAGDIEVDGIAYQIKYKNATFANERQLMAL